MLSIPDEIVNIMNDAQACKTIATRSKEGRVHTIYMGSLMCFSPEEMVFARILTKVTHRNLEEMARTRELVSILVTKGYQSFEIMCLAKGYRTSKEDMEQMDTTLAKMGVKKTMESMGLQLLGVWALEPMEIWNQGPGPMAGTRIA